MGMVDFLKENWIIVLIVLLVIIFIVNAMFKLAVAALVVGFIMVLFLGYSPTEVINIGKNVAIKTSNLYKDTVEPIIEKEIEGAEFITNPDKTYVIKTESVKLTGVSGSNVAKVTYKDKTFDIDISKLSKSIQDKIKSMEKDMETANSSEGAIN